jgi:hypothetical protein
MNGTPRRQILAGMSLAGTMAFLQRTASGQQNQQTRALPRTLHLRSRQPVRDLCEARLRRADG